MPVCVTCICDGEIASPAQIRAGHEEKMRPGEKNKEEFIFIIYLTDGDV